jgi:hypothetical protein
MEGSIPGALKLAQPNLPYPDQAGLHRHGKGCCSGQFVARYI